MQRNYGSKAPGLALILGALALAAACAAPSGQSAGDDAVDALAADVRALITPAGLEAQAAAIVRHERPSGSAGEFAAIDHIVETLTAAGVPVEVHEYMSYASTPLSASLEVPGTGFAPETITYSFSAPAQGLVAPVVDVGSLRDLPPLQEGTGERLVLTGTVFAPGSGSAAAGSGATAGGPGAAAPGSVAAGFPDVRGAIALVAGNPGAASVDRLEMLGAVGAIYVNQDERLNDLIVTTTWGTPSLRNYHRLPKLPAVHIKASDGATLRGMLARGPVRARLSAEVDVGWRPHRLAVATIPAGAAMNAPFVLFGGHIDAWYHGGTDEGASNAAMVELAKAFHAQRDRLRRSLVVAWWPGHSNARYGGSTWFADHYFDELRRRGVAYVNVDGIGQIDAQRFGAAASAALAGLAAEVVVARTGDQIEPRRPGRNSDQSFNGAGVPLLQINHSRLSEDGGYWWWHTPDDTFDKIDFEVLKTDTDLYADALAALLAAPVLPVDLVGQVATLGEAIARRQSEAGERFDLSEATARQEALLALVERLQGDIDRGAIAAADLELVRIIRPLHRVLYQLDGPFHPDSGLEGGALPGLAPARTLAAADPDSDVYRFAEVTLVRERNRLLEAIDEAIASAERLLESLP
ncbi:MAG TPA: M28 family peptidase [Acidobacteriota bacterium]